MPKAVNKQQGTQPSYAFGTNSWQMESRGFLEGDPSQGRKTNKKTTKLLSHAVPQGQVVFREAGTHTSMGIVQRG